MLNNIDKHKNKKKLFWVSWSSIFFLFFIGKMRFKILKAYSKNKYSFLVNLLAINLNNLFIFSLSEVILKTEKLRIDEMLESRTKQF